MGRYNKRNNNLNKYILLIIILLTLVVGYSLISRNIKINGNAGINKNTWNIHWDSDSIKVKNGSVTAPTPEVSNDEQEVSYTINFTKPGDFYEFTIDAINEGNIDGMVGINSLIPIIKDETGEEKSLPSYLKYTLTYSDGKPIEQYHLLKASETESFKVKIEFRTDINPEDLPDKPESLDVSTEVPYKQTDDNAYERDKTIEKYTITFNTNGGEVTPTSKEVIPEEAIGELPTPTRTNYLFDGWYTGQTDGTQVTEQTIPTGSVTYYAHWTSTIENLEVTPSSININVGETETLTITGPDPIENYTITSNNSTVATIENNVVTGVSEGTTTITIEGTRSHKTKTINVTITSPKYTITFNPNGGTVSPTSKEINQGDAIGELPTPTYTNNTFDGWWTDLQLGQEVDENYIPEGNVTIYAKWYPSDKVAEINGTYYDTLQLAINAVPTTGEETTVRLLKNTSEVLLVSQGQNVVLNLQNFTVSNSGTNNVIKNNGTLKIYNGTITTDTSQGAINNNSTGTLTISGGHIIATGTRQSIYNDGGTLTISGNAYISSSATERSAVHNRASGKITITGGTIISTNNYAIYNESGTLTIGEKDGSINRTNPVIQGKTYGIVANNTYKFYDGIIKGGTYHIGKTSNTGNTPTVTNDINETKITEIEEDSEKKLGTEEIGETTYKTLYLYKNNVITVTFDPNEGEVTPITKTINNGSEIGELPVPTRVGYIFQGWYTDKTSGTRINETYIPINDLTIYAQWQEKTTNTVVFNPNGGEVTPTEKDINPNEAIGELPTPTREGYKFLGWYTELTGGIKVDSTYVPQSKISYLYARWNNFPTVFSQVGACEFNGTGTITGSECTKYLNKTYIDTGIALYSNENYQKDYEIGFTIESYNPTDNPKQATFVNAKSEDSSVNWPGLAYRRETETDNLEITQTINGTKASNSISKDNVTIVRIVRIDGIVYYAYNDGELQELQDISAFNQQFALTTWFGAAPSNATGTSAQRYLNATLSNMYIKLGTYEEEGSYRITFNPNEGQVSTKTKKIAEGDQIGELPTPTREHYRFDGWYTGLTDGIRITEETIPTENTTYYAHWTEDAYYTITFNANDGEIEETTRKVYAGEALGELPATKKSGYGFIGWYTGLTDGIEVTLETIPESDATYYAHWLLLVDKTFTYNANEGQFTDDEQLNTIKYEYRNGTIKKYSHTSNIDDDGIVHSTYSSNTLKNDIVNIPDAEQINIEVWYSTESPSYDWLAIYPDGITPTVTNYNQATISNGKLGGGRSETKPSDDSDYHKSYTIEGDTAQFYFKSDGSSNYYGYYAIVTGECLAYFGDKDYQKPIRSSYVFKGWNTKSDGSGTSYANENEIMSNINKIEDNTTFYAQWREEITEFDIGSAVNVKMRTLSGNTYSYVNWDNTTIKSIVRSTTPPTINNMTKDNLVSSENSDKPIYAWYNNGTIYWWCEAEKARLNSDSSHMFRNLEALTSIDVSDFDTSSVTNMSYMFSECRKLTQLDLSTFDTSNVTDMQYMFKMESKNLGGGETSLQTINLSSFNTKKVTNMAYMFAYCEKLITLDVNTFDTSNVTDMQRMFVYCSSLTSLNLRSFDTKNVTNMYWMFWNCTGLTELNVSSFNTDNITNMSSMFSGCSSLTSLNLSNFNTINVTDMSSMFNGCSSLTSIDISSFDTSNVEFMGYIFSGCSSLTSIDVSRFDTRKVQYMHNMFYNCSSLTSINLNNLNTNQATSLSSMFMDCSSLTSIDVSSFDTSNVESMNSMFSGCSSLTSLNLSNFNTSNVESMNSMFSGCSSLITLNLNNFNTAKVIYMDSMFQNCSNLTSLNITNFNTNKVTTMNNLFSGCSSLENLNIGNFNVSKVTEMKYMFGSCTSLITLNINNFNTSSAIDMSYMFYKCSNLESLSINNFNTTNVENMTSMFQDCKKLDNINISMFNTSKVKLMTSMFSGCSSLTSLNISNFDTSSVTDMTSMFEDCQSLTSLNLSNFNTSNVESMTSMFNGCINIRSLDLSNFDASKVLDMSRMFYNCNNLTSLNVTNMNTKKITNVSYMFSRCINLTSIDLSDFNTNYVTNMSYMFSECQELTSLDLRNFNVADVTNMSYMFSGCKKLTNIDISSFNTRRVTNMSYMFNNCTNLIEIDLSEINTNQVTNMSYMFNNCIRLTELDLSNFETGKVINMTNMFNECTNLATIYSSSKYDVSNVTNSYNMFNGAISLIGGKGTIYNSNIIDKEYAKIDTASSPGYFTLKEGWVLINRKDLEVPSEHLLEQQWSYYENGERIESGFHILNDLYGIPQKYFFVGGVAQLGWIQVEGDYYYLSTDDDDDGAGHGNGYVNANAYRSSTPETTITKIIDEISYEFDSNGKCTNYSGTTFNTISLNANGGIVSNPQIINVNPSSQIGTLPTPKRMGYRFVGWYTGLTDGSQIDSSYIPSGNMTLYAHWRLSPSEVDFATSTIEEILIDYRAGETQSLEEDMLNKKQRTIQLDMNNDGTPETTAHIRIANISTPTECSTAGFSQTACGFVIEFTDVISTSKISEGNNSWDNTLIRTHLNETVYNALPQDIKDVVIDTNVVTGHGKSATSNYITHDKLYLLSTKEIFGKEGQTSTPSYDTIIDTADNQTRQLDLYKAKKVTTRSYSSHIRKGGIHDWWWLRTPYYDNDEDYYIITSDTPNILTYPVTSTRGISPAFRIG